MENRSGIGFQVGHSYKIENIVSQEDTALHYGSGGLEVLASPALIGYMEQAAFLSLEPYLSDGFSTVGISIHLEHIGAAIQGEEFECEAILTSFDEKKFIFRIESKSQTRKLGTAKHIRYLVHKQKFMDRINAK